jgi:adenylyltransferase/sulfurtransferase
MVVGKDSNILIVGVGGLGCPVSLGLAAEGFQNLTLMDPDKVELSNLHRQSLYSDKDLGKPKAETAAKRLSRLYPKGRFEPLPEALDTSNTEKVLSRFGLVVDGLDRLEKKFFLNDWCAKLGKPYVHAGVVMFEGQVMAVAPGETACLRCLIPKIPPPFSMPTCREAGVLGSFSQTVGTLAAREALRLLQGERPLRLWKMDLLKRTLRSILPGRNPACGACGKGKVEENMAEPACRV